jgi:SAM-dependent methyltransferase
MRSPKPSFSVMEDGHVKVTGYNNYIMTDDCILPDNINKSLFKLHKLSEYFNPKYLSGNTVLDIGCGTGMWSLIASRNGASNVNAIDIDRKHLDILLAVIRYFHIDNIKTELKDIKHYVTKHDVVLALAIVHWIYSCTTIMGSICYTIYHLRSLTNKFMLIEWVGPNDSAVKSFGHLRYNAEYTDKKYTKEEFLKRLNLHFSEVKFIGEGSRPGRELYYAHV